MDKHITAMVCVLMFLAGACSGIGGYRHFSKKDKSYILPNEACVKWFLGDDYLGLYTTLDMYKMACNQRGIK